MRIALTIGDPVYRRAKAEATRRGVTVAWVVEAALRAYLKDSLVPVQTMPPLTRSVADFRPGVDLDDVSAVWRMVDEGASFRDGAADVSDPSLALRRRSIT